MAECIGAYRELGGDGIPLEPHCSFASLLHPPPVLLLLRLLLNLSSYHRLSPPLPPLPPLPTASSISSTSSTSYLLHLPHLLHFALPPLQSHRFVVLVLFRAACGSLRATCTAERGPSSAPRGSRQNRPTHVWYL